MPSREQEQRRLASIEDRRGVALDLVKLEEALFAWRNSLAGLLPDLRARGFDLPDPLPADQFLAAHLDPMPDPQLLRRAAEGLHQALERFPAPQSAVLWWRRSADEEARERALAAWFSASWRNDREGLARMAADAGIDTDVFAWCGRELCRPFFHRLGETLAASLRGTLPARPTCPSCGGAPRLARLERDERQRHLWCRLCGIEWPYRRLSCPFCGNAEHEKLGYLAIEGTDSQRVDVCEVCRSYIRTVDERGLPEGGRVDFLAEDVATVHLCMAAEKRGYRPGGPGASGDVLTTPAPGGADSRVPARRGNS